MKGELTTGFGSNSISLRDGAGAMFRRKALVLLTFLTVVLGSAVVTLLLPNKYESRMKILVKNQRVDVAITPEATAGAPPVESEVSESQINSEIELLTSRDLLTQVVTECGLAKFETGWFGQPAPEAVRVETAAARLAKDLGIAPVKKANIISVSYSTNSPELAAAALKKLGDLYFEKHLKLHHPTGASDFFKDQADEYESQLKQAENRLADFQQNNNLVVLSQQKDLTLQKTADAKSKLLESEAAYNEATNRIKRVEQQLASTSRRVTTQSRTLPNQYSAERLNTMMVELQNRRTQLLTKFRPEDRLVREVDEQIRTTSEALAKAEQKTAVEENTDLKREVKEAEDNYQLYAKKREEARSADELDRQKITNVSIAEAATVAQIPSSPNRGLNLVLGVFLAAFLSLGSVFSAEMLSDAIHTPRQLEALTGAQVLATVPENSRRMIMRNSREPIEIETRPIAELQS